MKNYSSFRKLVVSLVVLHLVAAVGYLVVEETVKALEAKVAKLESQPCEEK